MNFHYNKIEDVAIDDIVSIIMTELLNNGSWNEIDPGYNVLSNPDNEYDISFTLDPTNKQYIEIRIGEHGAWNTTSHGWTGTNIVMPIVFGNKSSPAAGTEEGIIYLSYDESHIIFALDYTANANFWRSVIYCGYTTPMKMGDECLTLIPSSQRNSYINPPNKDEESKGLVRILHDISGITNKPRYATATLCSLVSGFTSDHAIENFQIYSTKKDVRYRVPIYLMSHSNLGGTAENAGVRCELKNIGARGDEDTETHGQIIKMINGDEYFVWTSNIDNNYGAMFKDVMFRVS